MGFWQEATRKKKQSRNDKKKIVARKKQVIEARRRKTKNWKPAAFSLFYTLDAFGWVIHPWEFNE